MNELLNSAEFLVHVAVPGAVAAGVTAGGGGDAPAGTSKAAERRARPVPPLPFSRFPRARARARIRSGRGLFPFKKHHLSDLMSMSVNAMY